MKAFIKELLRLEVNHTNYTFNGFKTLEEYTSHLSELFAAADFSELNQATRIQVEDLIPRMDAYLSIDNIDIEMITHDIDTNTDLKKDAAWYYTLYNIKGIKLYYYDKIMKMIEELFPEIPSAPEVIVMSDTQSNHNAEWITYDELIKQYSFKGVKSVKDAQWRKKHNFYPCKQEGKGCALRINVTELEKWLMGNKK